MGCGASTQKSPVRTGDYSPDTKPKEAKPQCNGDVSSASPEMSEEDQAAAKIGALYRGKKDRARTSAMREEHHRTTAAQACISSHVRGA